MSAFATMSDLNGWVEDLMKSLKVQDYKLNVSGNSARGDGYLGEVTFVTVATTKNNQKKNYELVIKSAKKSEELRKQTPIKLAYDREIFFYKKVYPVLEELQKECALEKPFTQVPKCFSVSSVDKKEALILQNLKTLGFDLHDRKKPMNLNHIHLVFRNYGKYHGLSLALKHKKPGVFRNLTKDMNDVLGSFLAQMKMFPAFEKNFEDLKKLLQKDHADVVKKFQGFEKEFEEILQNFSNESTNPCVISHGDCWNNNFMFKYEGSDRTKPTEMCFLDFQLSRVGSPILDLSYFLYCCADASVLKEIDFILQAYHSSLTDMLSELGCDAEEIFPFKTLKEQWKTYGKFGLVMTLFILKISLCEGNEAPDIMESAESQEGFAESFNFVMKDQSIYERRIKDVFLHFADKFL